MPLFSLVCTLAYVHHLSALHAYLSIRAYMGDTRVTHFTLTKINIDSSEGIFLFRWRILAYAYKTVLYTRAYTPSCAHVCVPMYACGLDVRVCIGVIFTTVLSLELSSRVLSYQKNHKYYEAHSKSKVAMKSARTQPTPSCATHFTTVLSLELALF